MHTRREAMALAGALMATASTRSVAQSNNVVKLGVVAGITGPVAFIAEPFANGIRLAVEMANAEAKGGRQYQLIVYDDEGSADKALISTKKLIQEDKVSAIMGPSSSGAINAVLPTIDAAQVPALYNSPIIDPKPGSFHFTPWPPEEVGFRVALNWMKSKGFTKLAVLASTDATGESGVRQINRLASEYGVQVVILERMDGLDKDVTPQFSNFRRATPETVFFVGTGAAVAVVCKSYTRLGFSQPLILSTGSVSATFPELLKGIAPDTLVFPTYKMAIFQDLPENDPSRPVIADFMTRYQARYQKRGDFYSGAGWDMGRIITRAVENAGSDPIKIRDYIQTIQNFAATIAPLSFAPDKHRGAGPDAQVMGQFKDGKFGLPR